MKNKILVIDDDETIAAIVESLLEPEGYEVTSAMDGETGLQQANVLLPDAILLDQKMRGMSGHDVLKHLRKEQKTRNIPVIMITGESNLRLLALSIDLGAQDYILKPLNHNILLTRLRNVIN